VPTTGQRWRIDWARTNRRSSDDASVGQERRG
jgi:hypothetical protein